MNNKKGRRLSTLILSGLCVLLLAVTGFTALSANNGKVAEAYITGGAPASIGSLTLSDYDMRTDGKVFDGTVLTKLYDKLLGNTGANEGKGTYNKVLKKVESSTSSITSTGSVTTMTSAKSMNFSQINGGNAITVGFGNKKWTVVYATIVNSDEVTLTLWETENAGTSVWNQYNSLATNTSNPYPSNMYSTSYIRVETLNAGGDSGTQYATSTTALGGTPSNRTNNQYAAFTLSSSVIGKKSLSRFITVPASVGYQKDENWVWSYAGSGKPYLCPNEETTSSVLTTNTCNGSGGWYPGSSGASDMRPLPGKANYYDWAQDKVWLPSLTETGYNNTENNGPGASLWGIPNSDSILKSSGISWLRSGSDKYAAYAWYLTASGGTDGAVVSSTAYAVRPALHLNLKSAALSAAGDSQETLDTQLPIPSDITVAYDGSGHWMTDGAAGFGFASDSATGYPDWFDKTLHADTGALEVSEIKYTGKNSTGTNFNTVTETNPTSVSVLEAGEYVIKLKIKDDYFTSTSGKPKYKWYNSTDQEKQIKITVTQKNATVTLANTAASREYGTANVGEVKPSFTPTITGAELTRIQATVFYKGTGTVWDNTTKTNVSNDYGASTAKPDESSGKGYGNKTAPADAGSYTASYADISTVSGYTTIAAAKAAACNYKLSNVPSGGALSFNFTIDPKKHAAPGVNAAQTYDQTQKTFNLTSAFDANVMDIERYDTGNTLILPDGSGKYADGLIYDVTAKQFKVTDAGTYEVQASLKDKRNHVWQDGSNTNKTFNVVVNKRALTISNVATGETGGAGSLTWELGSTGNITISHDAIGGDNVILYVYYAADSDPANEYPVAVGTSVLDVSTLTATGGYKLYARLGLDTDATGWYDAANDNYEIASSPYTLPFTIGAGTVNLDSIALVYKDSTMSGAANPLPLPTGANALKYKYDTNAKKPIEYFPDLDYTAINYLETVGTPAYKYADSTSPASGSGFAKAGTVTVTVRVQVKASEQGTHQMPLQTDYTGTKFTYTRVNDNEGILEFTYTIEKGDVDIDTTNLPLEYSADGKTTWKKYDATNLPQYTASKIYVRIAQPYPDGLTATTITIGESSTNIGTVAAMVSFTVDTANYNTVADATFNWEIGPEIIDVDWGWLDYYDANNNYYQVRILNYAKPDHANAVEYEFFTTVSSTDLNLGSPAGTPEALVAGSLHNGLEILCQTASPTNPVAVWVRARIKSGVTNYTLRDTSYNPLNPASVDCGTRFQLGDNKDKVRVTLNSTTLRYGDGKVDPAQIISLDILDANDNPTGALPATQYKVRVYKGSDKVNMANNTLIGELADFDTSTAGAGDYVIEIELVKDNQGETAYSLSTKALVMTIGKQLVTVPTLDEGKGAITFCGDDIQLQSYLKNYNASLMEFDLGALRRNAGVYSTVLSLLDPDNYEFAPVGGNTPVKFTLTADDEEPAYSATLLAGNTSADVKWKINKFVLGSASDDSIWNLKGKEGAALNFPTWVNDLIAAGGLEVNLRYYDDVNGAPLENAELKGGKTFYVDAVLGGDEAENFVFAKSGSGSTALNPASARVAYKVPQSGASAFMSNVKDFMTKTWMGLPIWAWFLIGLALLILLIIIIVVACKRRKTKEEKLAIKEAKEEEKRRREEERQRREEEREEERRRREEEREAEKRRREQELELEKAKQEAELAKMKAQMGLAGAGAGMAAMAMAQQPQQQLPQNMPQQMPQQPVMQPQYDSSVLAEIKAELAEIKARQNMASQQQMPMMQMPMQMQPQYSNNAGSANDPVMVAELTRLKAENEAHMKVELERARTETERARADAEIAKVRAESGRYAPQYQQIPIQAGNMPAQYIQAQAQPQNNQAFSAEALGSIIGGVLRGMNMPAGKPAQPRAVIEEQTQPTSIDTPTVYPADAVITTTTTVDTTKAKQGSAPRSDDGRMFDVDGFYDTFDEKNL